MRYERLLPGAVIAARGEGAAKGHRGGGPA